MALFDFIKKKELKEIERLSLENLQLKEINAKYSRYKEIVDTEAEIRRKKEIAESDMALQESCFLQRKKALQIEIEELESRLAMLQRQYNEGKTVYENLRAQTETFRETLDLAESGIYEPHFDFETSDQYKNEIHGVRQEVKVAIRNGWAVIGGDTISFNGSASRGKAIVSRMKKVILKAFNGEVDSFIANVDWNNIAKMEQRINKSAESINMLYRDMDGISISQRYLELRKKELYLAYEYKRKKYEEKEAQRAIREQMREEEKAQREIEAAMLKAQREEESYQKALERARAEMETSIGAEQEKLLLKIKELEARVLEAEQNKERALSMAQQTKRGYVYVISNIGSFGENVYKIGMTRRLEPMDRIRELGDASVPFPFDVHAIIFSENAPALEAHLHKVFETRRTNMVNPRKEFFSVSLSEIEDAVKAHGANIEFTRVAEARDWRETSALNSTANKRSEEMLEKFPDNLFDYTTTI